MSGPEPRDSAGLPPVLAWRASWARALLGSRPGRLAFAAALLLLALGSAAAFLPPLAGGALVAVLVLSLDQLLFPVAYRLDAEGVRARTFLRTRRHVWEEFTDAVETPHGLLLCSPVRRSLHLLAPAGREGEVRSFARERLGAGRVRPQRSG